MGGAYYHSNILERLKATHAKFVSFAQDLVAITSSVNC